MCPTAHLDVDSLLGLLAVEQAFDVEVGAARVLVNGRTDPLPLTGDDHVRIHRCRRNESEHGADTTTRNTASVSLHWITIVD